SLSSRPHKHVARQSVRYRITSALPIRRLCLGSNERSEASLAVAGRSSRPIGSARIVLRTRSGESASMLAPFASLGYASTARILCPPAEVGAARARSHWLRDSLAGVPARAN